MGGTGGATNAPVPTGHRRSDMPQRTCSVDGCDKPTRSPTGPLCNAHRLRWQRHGSLDLRTRANGEGWAEFERLADLETDECVLWTGSIFPDGYGWVSSPETHGPVRVYRIAL